MFKTSVCVLCSCFLLSACAIDPNKLRLSDLGTRHWKGTVYLSVKETPTSIKCSINPSYETVEDIPVIYQGEDALPLFDLTDDIRKITALRQECLDRSFSEYRKH